MSLEDSESEYDDVEPVMPLNSTANSIQDTENIRSPPQTQINLESSTSNVEISMNNDHFTVECNDEVIGIENNKSLTDRGNLNSSTLESVDDSSSNNNNDNCDGEDYQNDNSSNDSDVEDYSDADNTMSSLPNRCLVKELQNDRELMLPISAILVRDPDTGLLTTASKADIELQVPIYMQSGENVVEVMMIRYAETKRDLLSYQRSASKKRIQIRKKLSLTPYESRTRSKIVPQKSNQRQLIKESQTKKKSFQKAEKTARAKSVVTSDNAIMELLNADKENNNISNNIPMQKENLNNGENSGRNMTQLLSVLTVPRTESSYEESSRTPFSPPLIENILPKHTSISTRREPFKTLQSHLMHQNPPQDRPSLIQQEVLTTPPSHSSRQSTSSGQRIPRSLQQEFSIGSESRSSQLSTPTQRSTPRLLQRETSKTPRSHLSGQSTSSGQRIRRLLRQEFSTTPESRSSQLSTSSQQNTSPPLQRETSKTPQSHSSRQSISSKQSASRSTSGDNPRTRTPYSLNVRTSSKTHAHRSAHGNKRGASQSEPSKPYRTSRANADTSNHRYNQEALRSPRSPSRSRQSSSSPNSNLTSRSSSSSSRSSSSRSSNDLDEMVSKSELRHGFKLFRKRMISDVEKIIKQHNLGRPSSTNGKVRIEGILLDAKNFLRALLAKE
ncbi:hypothetical protein KQX54_015583 [Cotesia glomerata]|uniref:Uncharacterized protein n=1 Tax=Cotesia glomerata TaxID=32391 RepID=A0AAV7HYI4_COTGL|nr:hypothetical protein KQX54_015583 [Cotesia glomerata]